MSLSTLFNPKSIAVIGASTTPGSVGHILIQNLLEEHYPGKIFPVNPKTDTLQGLPCYASVKDIQEPVDLCIIVVPAGIVPTVLQETADAKIKNVIIISAGFKEAGIKGKVLEKQVEDIAKQNEITLLGPNCLGFLHSSRILNASFAADLPAPGDITFFSQSGALCTTLLDETKGELGYAHFVSIGNKTLTKEAELLEYFLEDSETRVIAFYTEDLQNSERLIELGQKAILSNPPKPIIVLKGGSTNEGSQASSSHTGAVAGSHMAYETLFQEAYFHSAQNLRELRSLLTVFSQNPIPAGNRLAIVTNAGGLGVLTTDQAIQAGLTLANLENSTQQDLSLSLPAAAASHNPVDVLGDAPADRYKLALNLVTKDPHVDMILVMVTPQAMTEAEKTAQVIIEAQKKSNKPVVAVFTKGCRLEPGVKLLQKEKVSVFHHADEAIIALAHLSHMPLWQEKAKENLDNTPKQTPQSFGLQPLTAWNETGYVEESLARHALEKAGFAFPKTATVTSEKEAESAKGLFTSPVVLKILSPDIIHKSDAGGVLLNISPEDIPAAYNQILEAVKESNPKAKIEGVVIAEMIKSMGQELLMGLKNEPGLGKLLVFGMGGIYVEVLADVRARFVPLTKKSALELLQELKSAPLLFGTRGQKGMDTELLVNAICTLSDFALAHPEIQELDMNPVVLTEEGKLICLDARIRV